jgi:DNA-binding HxlR family transcriptional regulator
VLTDTLRRLEYNGLVERHRYAEAPPRVEYELTGPGRDLLRPIYALGDWADRHAESVLAAQERADLREDPNQRETIATMPSAGTVATTLEQLA